MEREDLQSLATKSDEVLELKANLKQAEDDRDKYHELLNASLEGAENLQSDLESTHQLMEEYSNEAAKQKEIAQKLALAVVKDALKRHDCQLALGAIDLLTRPKERE